VRFSTCPLRLGAQVAVFAGTILAAGCTGSNVTTPIATPSPGPAGVLSASPSSLALFGTGSSNAGSVFVQETGYGGTFSESDTCAGVAAIAPSSGRGPSTTFGVTGAAAGTCTATFSDVSGQKVSSAITVTTTGFGVQSQARGAE
jgi:hypothetical protein